MRVTWSENARNAVRKVSDYVSSEFGRKSKSKFLQEIDRVGSLLEENPFIGQIEPYLSDCPEQYRYIVVNRLNKIIYYVKEDCIEIVALWDTRREPKRQANKVK